jgi:hypothetical protein
MVSLWAVVDDAIEHSIGDGSDGWMADVVVPLCQVSRVECCSSGAEAPM